MNQCWSMDFVSDTLYNKQKFRALTIIDHFSRKCVAIEVGQSLKGNDVVNTLEQLHLFYGIKSQRIKVDNGPEFVSKEIGSMGIREIRNNLTNSIEKYHFL